MCGIAGVLSSVGATTETMNASLGAMAKAIAHRGPDDQGVWCDASVGVGFSHRRLSIIDLSPLGHQPMISASGRYVVTYNGEIYNYAELKAELTDVGCGFRGASDTEVLLAAVETWGVEKALQRAVGMFALGLWDRNDRQLILARDRFGEKPLYYGLFGGVLLFGSELRALRQHPAWAGEVDRDALALFIRYDYVPAPHSIFRQVRKLLPGQVLRFRIDGREIATEFGSYWNARDEVGRAIREPLLMSADAMVNEVEAGLTRAIRRQMVADVPVGAFLSGGVDSSLVVALMQQSSSQAVRTYSMGFSEKEFDESGFAAAIARHLGTQHQQLIVTPKDTLDVIPRLPQIYDEPFADSSQIPTFLVSQLARRGVTVSLSGDGGDELFGGYERYADVSARWKKLRRPTSVFRRAAGRLLALLPHASHKLSLTSRLREHAPRWGAQTFPELYSVLISLCQWPTDLVRGVAEPRTIATNNSMWPMGINFRQHMMFVDSNQYLPDDVLVKVDRAAMAVALETRVPLLDPEVAYAAWRIPTDVHFRDGRGKWILRQILSRHVPTAMFDRPKMGFAVPVAKWLRGELRPWASELLDGVRLRRDGYLDDRVVASRWRQHSSGAMDWSPNLWGLLMFQAWLEAWERDQPLRVRSA